MVVNIIFFNFYINKLVERLSRAVVGCWIDDVELNNFSYGNDLILLNSSVNGLRRLIKICHGYAKENRFRYNAKNSETLIFRKNKPLNFNPNTCVELL